MPDVLDGSEYYVWLPEDGQRRAVMDYLYSRGIMGHDTIGAVLSYCNNQDGLQGETVFHLNNCDWEGYCSREWYINEMEISPDFWRFEDFDWGFCGVDPEYEVESDVIAELFGIA